MKNIKISLILALGLLVFSCGSDDDPVAQPNPTITTISPTSGPKTTIVTINGQDFGTDLNNVSVYFNDVEGTVQAVTNTQITAQVPARAYTGIVKVVVSNKETNGPIFTYTIIDIQTSTFAGSTEGNVDGQGANAQFAVLGQMAMDSNGTIFVADPHNHRIRKITPSGVVSTFAGSTSGFADGQGTNAQFNSPYGLAIDSNDTVFVCDSNNNKIRKITPSGVVSTFAGSTNGNVDGQGTTAQFRSPIGITIDADNTIYVGDEGNYNIRKITPNGMVSTLAGSGSSGFTNGQGTAAQFTSPTGLAVDKQGTIYVADYSNHKIRKITPNGMVSTFVGSTIGFTNGNGSNTQFYNPYDVIVDTNYDVYVADRGNYKIRKITQE